MRLLLVCLALIVLGCGDDDGDGRDGWTRGPTGPWGPPDSTHAPPDTVVMLNTTGTDCVPMCHGIATTGKTSPVAATPCATCPRIDTLGTGSIPTRPDLSWQ